MISKHAGEQHRYVLLGMMSLPGDLPLLKRLALLLKVSCSHAPFVSPAIALDRIQAHTVDHSESLSVLAKFLNGRVFVHSSFVSVGQNP